MIVSIIVPLYQGQKYINNIIEMATKNCNNLDENHEIELIFVNDYPTEKIYFQNNAQNRLKISLITNKKNEGIHYSRVKGMQNSRGEFVLFLDQDDSISDRCIRSQLETIENHNLVVGNGTAEYPTHIKKLYRYKLMQKTVNSQLFYALFDSRIISPGHCLIRKSSIPDVWKNNILSYNGADDMFLWMILLTKKEKFAINRDYIYQHKYTAQNASLDTDLMHRSVREFIEISRKEECIDNKYLKIIERRLDDKERKKKRVLLSCILFINHVGEKINAK